MTQIINNSVLENSQLITAPEAAAILCVSKQVLYRMVKNKKIPHYRFNHQVRFSRDELRQYLESHKHDVVD